jgi:ribosomal protein S18 acetylase RimI-like enzyme
MNDLLVRELASGEESLWFELNDERDHDDEKTDEERLAEFRKEYSGRSGNDGRLFLIALDGARPVGRLKGVFLDLDTYLILEVRTAEGLPCSVIEDALIGHLAPSFSRDGITVFSSDHPRNREINSALDRAGFTIDKKKAYVGRSLEGELPEPEVAFGFLTLAEVGREKFVGVMTEAAEGDPFEDMEGRDPDADFQELVEMAGERFDESEWYLPLVDGEIVGVLLPQAFPDSEAAGTMFYVGVLPRFRGRGYGRALHATGLSMLAARGVTKYIGSTDTRNTPMLRIFEANGCPQTNTQFFFKPPATRATGTNSATSGGDPPFSF